MKKVKKAKAAQGIRLYNRGERKFVIKGNELLEGGERLVDIRGQETGIIKPEAIVTVSTEKAKYLLKNFKGEIKVWGDEAPKKKE